MQSFIVDSNTILFELQNKITRSDYLLLTEPMSGHKHLALDTMGILSIYLLDYDENYVLLFNHYDSLYNVNELQWLETDRVKYVYDKTKLLYLLPNSNKLDVLDVKIMYYCHSSKPLRTISLQYSSPIKNMPYSLIPIYKLIEKHELEINDSINIIKKIPVTETIKRYHKNQMVLFNIETNGLLYDKQKFIDIFDGKSPSHLKGEKLYTQYDMYTTTGRPSNTFKGINFSALNKSNGERNIFVSRFKNGELIELDFQSYHLRLIANILNYNLPSDIHTYFGKTYFDTDILTNDQYDESKTISFKQLYGYSDSFTHVFFKKTHEFRNKLYNQYLKHGYVVTPLLERKITHKNLTINKLFNYYIQALEFEHSMTFIATCMNEMRNLHTKIILYTYDSFLLDIHPKERDIIDKIKTIGNTYGFVLDEKNYVSE